MKIAIIGDMHLGAFQADERREDSFVQAREAVELALKENADLILLTGDVFDSRVPTQDVLAKAMEILHLPKKKYPLLKQEAEIEKLERKNEKEIPRSALFGIPVIAIHGNHDRRGKGLINPVELLEKAGLLIHLNVATIILRIAKSQEPIAIHGMSYVPEKYAREVLQKFNPTPVKGAINIFLFHQSVGQYLYSDEEHPTLMLEDLPRGFNLVVDGHIHWADTYSENGLNFLLVGSTISTQMRKIEAERPKVIHIFENGKIRQKKIETQRELFYETLTFNEIEPDLLRKKVSEILEKIPEKNKKPLVRLVLKGTIKHGFEAADLNLHKIEEEFRDRCILHIGREKLFSKEAAQTREILEQLLKKQISIDERGLQILQQNLAETNFKDTEVVEQFLNTLIEEGAESAYKFLRTKFNNS